jgi:ubiquitin C-terminal hydrolase
MGHSPVIREWLQSKHSNDGQKSLTQELADVMHHLWTLQNNIMPHAFVNSFFEHLSMFQRGEQHDLIELWTMLCDNIGKEHHNEPHRNSYIYPKAMMDDLQKRDKAYFNMTAKACVEIYRNNKENACLWTDFVQGVQVSQIECVKCKSIFHNLEPWTVISIDLPTHDDRNIVQSIEKYMDTITVEEWQCDRCKTKGQGEQTVRFWKLPSVFIVSIKRFEYDASRGSMRKLGAPIDIPEFLQFYPPHVFGLDARSYMVEHNNRMNYRLCSVGMHHGSAHHGHYTAVGRVKNDEWFHYDDLNVFPCHPQHFMLNNPNAYMLVYELCDQ